MLDHIHFPKQDTERHYDYYEFESQLLNSVLSGDSKKSSRLYKNFFTINKLFDESSSSSLRSIKNKMVSLLSVICHSVIKHGVSPHSARAMYSEATDLIEKSNTVNEIFNLSKSIIVGFSVQTRTGVTAFKTDNPTIKKVLHYIHDNLGQPLTLKDVAAHVHLSKYYFCTQFKKEMNMSFVEYINHARIEKSKFFLCHSDKSILDIAILLGFNNQEYFTTVFKRYTGTTPKKFRIENESYY